MLSASQHYHQIYRTIWENRFYTLRLPYALAYFFTPILSFCFFASVSEKRVQGGMVNPVLVS